jgi:hypothetical protein
MKVEELQFFDPRQEISVSKNRLTHWQQQGRIYFVTFRLGDAIPQEKLERWGREKSSGFGPIQRRGLNEKHVSTSISLLPSWTAG